MADELELELDRGQDGVGEDLTTGQDEDRQPEPGEKPINLDDLPDFRKWKSQMDQRLDAVARQAQTEAQRARELEQQWHRERMEGMDELQRAQYENQLLQKQLQEMARERQLQEYASRREADIAEVAATLNLDRDQLRDALPQGADSYVLWQVAHKMATGREAKAAPDRQAANRVDVGGGPAPSKSSKYQKLYDEAIKNYDMAKALDIMAEADRAGVTLRE